MIDDGIFLINIQSHHIRQQIVEIEIPAIPA